MWSGNKVEAAYRRADLFENHRLMARSGNFRRYHDERIRGGCAASPKLKAQQSYRDP